MSTLWITLFAVMSSMLLLWIGSIYCRDVSIVDPFWGLGFVLISWIAWYLTAATTTRATLLVVLVTIWGLRLSLYLFWRHSGQPEDSRYAAMRKYWGTAFWRISLFTVFLFQGIILWLISWPIQISIYSSSSNRIGIVDWLGVIIFTIGIGFETIGDWQLASFKANSLNADRVLDAGLWKYTRHPNYFGDFCVWWGLYCISSAGGAWWTFFSPLLMSVLLLKVSGVGLLEKTIGDRRAAYREYQNRTSSFIPWPPRANAPYLE